MKPSEPLADRLRPTSLQEFSGQQHLLSEGKPLYEAIQSGQLHSLVLWGPPGVGKTTLARIIAQQAEADFISLSAVLAGVKDIRAVVEQAKKNRIDKQQNTLLFVDEVHRFNKSQQDAFLPHVEAGVFTFIGATTENPSFSLNNALLSRARVYTLKSLEEDDLRAILNHALTDKNKGLDSQFTIDNEAIQLLLNASDKDARRLLNFIELSAQLASANEHKTITANIINEVVQDGVRRFDNHGEDFYNQISALHKSVRGSNPDASLYWLKRMLDGGCDPLYVARRIVRIASEDIGNADPRALQIALNAWETQEKLGSPEGELALAQAVIYLACAAKSNAVYSAFNAVDSVIKKTGSLDVPYHLRNAPTALMKQEGYHEGYRYAHNEPNAFAAGENYLPEALIGSTYYEPVDRGLEIKIAEKLRYLRELNQQAKK
ncbi:MULTISPECIES: replication-associated recombination protein A [Cycloclasticus]|uniref:Replication-associated recombination protein A n=1 Tax=Cycloclasticus pugetii TaxID=34068 RepID=A0AB33YZY3_9GAMM|nr:MULTISPECIES: replication-associated recombination protein A [Cycloclasticus]ATI03252.1 replication-associated recombination protein A [Cycloclasticus sp. PY97N]EPD12695.1 ATPase [Cycloclasticus pugetii]